MKKYNVPKIDVTEFESADVVTTSGLAEQSVKELTSGTGSVTLDGKSSISESSIIAVSW